MGETITRHHRSTFDAAENLKFYIQIILLFYQLQATPPKCLRFLGESLYAEVYPVAPIPHSIRTGWIASTPLFYYDIGETPRIQMVQAGVL